MFTNNLNQVRNQLRELGYTGPLGGKGVTWVTLSKELNRLKQQQLIDELTADELGQTVDMSDGDNGNNSTWTDEQIAEWYAMDIEPQQDLDAQIDLYTPISEEPRYRVYLNTVNSDRENFAICMQGLNSLASPLNEIIFSTVDEKTQPGIACSLTCLIGGLEEVTLLQGAMEFQLKDKTNVDDLLFDTDSNKNKEANSMDIEKFCESADVYAVNSSVWLVDGDAMVATHCSDVTYSREDWDAVYAPTREKFMEFLKDENYKEIVFDCD